MTSCKFNEDYFERGVETGVGLYQNFRWIPPVSIEIAGVIKRNWLRFSDNTVIDYGCAKGYVVSALRLIGVDAWGYDISEYAISSCREDTKKYLTNNIVDKKFDALFSKDVLEHVSYEDFERTLRHIRAICRRAMIIVPLADNNKYRIPEYEYDVTHIIKEDEEWWIKYFVSAGFSIDDLCYNYYGIKQKWVDQHKYGNGFFFLR